MMGVGGSRGPSNNLRPTQLHGYRCVEEREGRTWGGRWAPHSPIEPQVVLPVSDEVGAGGQEVPMQLFPGSEHPLWGGLAGSGVQ